MFLLVFIVLVYLVVSEILPLVHEIWFKLPERALNSLFRSSMTAETLAHVAVTL